MRCGPPKEKGMKRWSYCNSRRCRASLPEVVDVGAAAPISQGYGNLHILWNVPRNLLMEDVALDESHRRQVSLFTCFGDDAHFVTLVPEHALLDGMQHLVKPYIP